MKKLFLLLITFLFLLTAFSGCTEYNKYCKIEGSGLNLEITDASEPLHLDIVGNENTIKIDKDVVLTEISCAWGFKNNTFMIYGASAEDKTSTWQNHNCTVKGISAEYGNIIKYRGD
jgi:hypothetical protein